MTGINEQNSKATLTIFPNPFSESAIVEMQGVNYNWQWTLSDDLGQIVQSIMNVTDKKLIVRKEDLQPGIYIYKIQTEKEFVTTGRLIIQ